ncbi:MULTISPECIES: transketolase [Brucella/Ochrobactrum group]|uniref:Transketolase n=2 Tax=Ochrobactrum TaxID=528 RepID=A0A2P9HQB2_9HYPH|nr:MULTISPECIES: transketolase [Brucella]MCI0999965.1 transketolase [Ochrobactrum sp. C6C9]RRD24227.1 transketolase [Brucellaceae bacterium VT-16-1752]WHT41807.1 transketolase [Ochrobactrum sp. SSR]MDX4073527.1 transketolase [Brucella sp. NBRC 113783]NNU62160.1 transketolase [[Ochrobactrum] soli]
MSNSDKQNQLANAIRFLSMDAVEKANSGHPGLPMGAADIATTLYTRFLSHDPQNPHWPDRDRFVLSAGHGSMLLYSLLYLSGYEDITIDEIKNFRQLGSRTAGHPEYGHAAGIETTTGPLGQGIANAVGMALSERILNAQFGDSLVNHYTYVLVGDGCLMEGISQEAISLAGHLKLNKLIAFWDDNNISIDGPISMADNTNQPARFAASGWNTLAVDGHDQEAIAKAIELAKVSDKPTLIACKTTIGFGAPNKAGTNKVHGSPLGAEEIAATRKALGWSAEPFVVPAEVLDAWRVAGLNAAKKRQEWEKRFAAADAETRAEFERRMRGDLPAGFDAAIVEYKKKLSAEKPKVATRKSSEMALEVINGVVPETIGGSADLTGSNNTKTSQTKAVTPENYGGRYVHYGIRELGMSAAMNGITLHGGLIPYSGTFLTFSDYARPAMRLSSLMGIRVIYVMTHDSIGLGEDGPTHQPVEHLAALRAIPNHNVFRPADAVETAECWQIALQSTKTPSTLALTRQNLPVVRTEHREENLSAYGAYELATASDDAKVTIFATGSEVEIALKARDLLEGKGIATRVVSVPCFELFEGQSDAYKQATIGNAPVKLAIEAAISLGWERFIGEDGIFIGMKGFGASGEINDLYKHFGITAEHAVAAAEKKLNAAA